MSGALSAGAQAACQTFAPGRLPPGMHNRDMPAQAPTTSSEDHETRFCALLASGVALGEAFCSLLVEASRARSRGTGTAPVSALNSALVDPDGCA
jgi:hypothetical protein